MTTQLLTEQWKIIPDFPNYEISSFGRIYNRKHDLMMSSNPNNFGHIKISLLSGEDRCRYTRSVALMVAEAFVPVPNSESDSLVVLDGNFENVAAYNLAWRPKSFAWRYTRQLKEEQPIHYLNLSVVNVLENVEFESIVQAGIAEGLLFDDIWRSTYTKEPVYPTGSIFEVIGEC